eukprot:SAG11_NODE_5120_length_1658_cov_1.313663_1_plen_461_part_10
MMATPQQQVQAAIEAAGTSLLGAGVWEQYGGGVHVPREAVLPAGGKRRGGADLYSQVPLGTFKRLQAGGRRASNAPNPTVATGVEGGVCVSVASEFDFVHKREFGAPAELAAALLEAMQPPQGLLADARADPSGSLCFITQIGLERQRGLGRLLCTGCGCFFAGEKGLRHHQQVKHGASYEMSKDIAEIASNQQLQALPGANGGGAGEDDDSLFLLSMALQQARIGAEAEAAARRAARAALHPALEMARDGDLARLQRLWHAQQTGGAGGAARWDPVSTADRHGCTALHWAAGGGHLELCQWLVAEAGVPAAIRQPKDGRNALHWACRNGRLVVARWLVEVCGVDPSLPTKDGTAPFHWAVWQEHEAVAAWLIDEAGADWRATNGFGCNAVQWAALSGSVRMCQWLSARGLDMGLLNRNGHSALHKAAVKGQRAACAWLLGPGGLGWAHLQADGDGNTPAE